MPTTNHATPEPRTPGYWTPGLYDIAQALESVENPEVRIERVFGLMREFVPYDRCVLLETAPVLGGGAFVVPDASPAERIALSERLSTLLELLSERSEEARSGRSTPRSTGRAHLAVPIIGLGETTGIVLVERAEPAYDESHLAFLSVVAGQIGAYLAAVRSTRKLRASEAKRADLLEQRESDLSFLEMFMGMLGHDLRNPLSAIRMCAEHLRHGEREQVTAHLPELTRRILSGTDRMERMVDQLLDLTRIRLAGGLPVSPKRVDLGEVCRRVVDEMTAIHPDASIHHSVVGDVSGQWDDQLLLQLVSNLVANAIQHGERSQAVTLRVTGAEHEVELATYNAGVISEALHPVLFDPFRGAQDGGARKGLGLGLYISKHIVEAHGGSIEVDSAAARGTTFTVRLPRRPPGA